MPPVVGSGVLPVTPTANVPWRVRLPFVSDGEEGDVLGLHVRDIHRPAVRRDGETLRRDAAGELKAGLSQDLRGIRRGEVDTEDFDLVGVQLR